MSTRRPYGPAVLLLLSLSLAAPNAANAQASASGSISFTDPTASPTAGTIQLQGPWSLTAFAQAQNSLGELSTQSVNGTSPLSLNADAMVTFATAHGDASAPDDPPDFNLSAHASGSVNLPPAPSAQAITTGRGSLSDTFMLTGVGTTTDVTFSANLSSMIDLMTGPYGQLAQAETIFTLSLDGSVVLFRDELQSIGPNSTLSSPFSGPLSATVAVTPGVSHTLRYEVDAETQAIVVTPEPASIALILPGLVVLAGLARRRRAARS